MSYSMRTTLSLSFVSVRTRSFSRAAVALAVCAAALAPAACGDLSEASMADDADFSAVDETSGSDADTDALTVLQADLIDTDYDVDGTFGNGGIIGGYDGGGIVRSGSGGFVYAKKIDMVPPRDGCGFGGCSDTCKRFGGSYGNGVCTVEDTEKGSLQGLGWNEK